MEKDNAIMKRLTKHVFQVRSHRRPTLCNWKFRDWFAKMSKNNAML